MASPPAWRCARCQITIAYYEIIPAPTDRCLHSWVSVPSRLAHGKEVPPDRYLPLADYWDVLK